MGLEFRQETLSFTTDLDIIDGDLGGHYNANGDLNQAEPTPCFSSGNSPLSSISFRFIKYTFTLDLFLLQIMRQPITQSKHINSKTPPTISQV